ncbi:MAG: alpha/beta hydrolase [Streptosporangiaceae bacterium]|nr:alpha/beta hydrolase [Streptosporangiaceae bacterium]
MTEFGEQAPGQPRTFVLIPGAGGAAWYWYRVVPLLREAGHEAIAVDLPGPDPHAGLPEYARLISAAIADAAIADAAVPDAAGDRRDVVLVAQSMGGFTAPLAAAAASVSEIVFVNAMIPVPGETPNAWGDNTGAAKAREAAAERGGYGTELDLDTYFLHDVPADVAATGEPHQRPEAEVAFESVCDFSAWPPVPVRVLAGADDRLFPADFQQRVARERLGVEADVLPGGHLIALSQPEAVARYLLGYPMAPRSGR